MGQRLPTPSNPRAPSLQHPSYCYCQFLVSCCVFLLSFGHKANSLPISLIFEGSLYGAQNRVTNPVSSANPEPGTMLGYFGSLSAMFWWRHWPTHGGRGQSRWGVGQGHFMMVVVCFVLLFFVVDRTLG
jgi:hypothetical protein